MFEGCYLFRVHFPDGGERLNVMLDAEMIAHFRVYDEDPTLYFIRREIYRHKRDPRRAVVYRDIIGNKVQVNLIPFASFI
jgi:hypothetical protein